MTDMPLERHVLVSSSHSLSFIFGLLLTLTLRNTHHEHHVMASKKKMFSRVLPWKGHIVLWHVAHARWSQVNSLDWQSSFCVCDWIPSCQVGSANGHHFGSPVGESFQKAYLEEWIHMGDDSSGEQCMENIPTMVQGTGYLDCTTKSDLKQHLQHQDQWAALCSYLGASWTPGHCILLGKNGGTIGLHQDLGAILFTRSSSVLFLNAWSCRFQVKRSCRASRILSPRAQTNSLRG